jgi:hypothetical protein
MNMQYKSTTGPDRLHDKCRKNNYSGDMGMKNLPFSGLVYGKTPLRRITSFVSEIGGSSTIILTIKNLSCLSMQIVKNSKNREFFEESE